MPSPADDGIAKDMAQKAFKARQAGRLAEAADLMEEAFNKSPELTAKVCASCETLALRYQYVTQTFCELPHAIYEPARPNGLN